MLFTPRIALWGIPQIIKVRAFSTSPGLFRSDLSYQVFGPEKESATRNPIVFLHGLFGSKQNNRSISRALARDVKREVYIVDLRNHGASFHDTEHTYPVMANDVADFINEHGLTKCVLIGHSMGAKAAMTLALTKPSLVSSLIPVDNAPVTATLKSDFAKYITGMKAIESSRVTKQSDADAILERYEKSLPIRQFLLTNLVRDAESGTMKFRVPLGTLGDALKGMGEFPFNQPGEKVFGGPTLVVRGTRSPYVKDETRDAIKGFFPDSRVVDVESGHWVISENPEGFRKAVVEFLENVD